MLDLASILGFLVLLLLIMISPAQARVGTAVMATAVNVITAKASDVVPRALGYGTVEPDVKWQAIAEVGGQIVYLHPELESGASLPAGTLVLKINPQDYQLALVQAQAEQASSQARLGEFEAEE